MENIGVLNAKQIRELKLIHINNSDKKYLSKEDMMHSEIVEEDLNKYFPKAAYYFSLGDEYINPSKRCSKPKSDYELCDDCEILCDNKSYKVEKCTDYRNKKLIIKPFSTIIISTLESIKIPHNVVGRLNLRAEYAMRGLILQVGNQIVPSSTGKLFGLLLNFSCDPIELKVGEKIISSEFSYVHLPSNSDNASTISNFSNMHDFLKRNHYILTNGGTLDKVKEEVAIQIRKEYRETREKILTRTTTLISILIAVIALAYALFPFIMDKRYEKLDRKIEDIRLEIHGESPK